jgi:hypothetical protein
MPGTKNSLLGWIRFPPMATEPPESDLELPEAGTYASRLGYALSLLKKLPSHQRVVAAAKAARCTPEALYTVLKDKSGKRALTAVNNARVAAFCKVDPTWLATGEGLPRPRPLSTEALDVAELYEALGDEERKKFWLLLQVVKPPAPPPTDPPKQGSAWASSSKARV